MLQNTGTRLYYAVRKKWEFCHSLLNSFTTVCLPLPVSLSELLFFWNGHLHTSHLFKNSVAWFLYTCKLSLLWSTFFKTYMILQNVVSISYYGVFEYFTGFRSWWHTQQLCWPNKLRESLFSTPAVHPSSHATSLALLYRHKYPWASMELNQGTHPPEK